MNETNESALGTPLSSGLFPRTLRRLRHTEAHAVARTLVVAALAGLALNACNDVSGPASPSPEIHSITPSALWGGQQRTVTVRGRGFGEGVYSLGVRRVGVTITDVQVISDSVLAGELFVASTALVGATTAFLEVDGRVLNDVPFEVTPTPSTTIDSIRPAMALRGDTVAATIYGLGFVADSTAVSIDVPGLELLQQAVVSNSRMEVVLAVSPTTMPGARQLRASTYGLTTQAIPFEVVSRATVSLQWISGGERADSIGALLDTVVVEVRDDRGYPQPQAPVDFSGVRPDEAADPRTVYLILGSPPSHGITTRTLTRITGADGRASVAVRAGAVSGSARVAFGIAELALSDSVQYSVLPGDPVRVEISRRHGAILVDDTLRFTPVLLDRQRNVHQDSIVPLVVEGVAATHEGGGLVRGTALGNANIKATWGARTDSVDLAVVPSGRIVAVREQSLAAPRAVILQELTGADERDVVSMLAGFNAFSPYFQPATGQLATESALPVYETGAIWVGDTLGDFSQQVDADPTLEYQRLPVVSFDGAWLYFTGTTPQEVNEVWRLRIGEDSLERLTLGGVEGEFHPAPSPDGQRVAFTRLTGGQYSLQVMDLETKASAPIAAGVFSRSRWSPTGEWIAALREGTLWLIAPDGVTSRQLEPALSDFQSAPNWSPDGRWLIVRRAGRQELINVESEVRIRLPWTELIRDASFVVVR